MIKHNQNGGLVPELVIAIVLLIGAIVFGAWAFMSRQDYKSNVDSKIASAVSTAEAAQQQKDAQKEAEDIKQPLSTYNGPADFGSLVLQFPKTWGAYVDTSNSGTPVNGYFYPVIVPSVNDQDSIFSLRVQVLTQGYSDVLQSLKGQKGVSYQAYALPSVPKSVGVRASGTINVGNGTKTVDMVVLPLRSDTLEVWTEGTQFKDDFETVLAKLSFSP